MGYNLMFLFNDIEIVYANFVLFTTLKHIIRLDFCDQIVCFDGNRNNIQRAILNKSWTTI